MSPRKRILFGCLAAILVCHVVVLSFLHTKSDTESRTVLPGYSVIYQGNTNTLKRAWCSAAFARQHPMMPYLELVAPRLKFYEWPQKWPIRIEETESTVVIILPDQRELGLVPPMSFSSGYMLKVVIDKKTMQIIDATQG
jgi:hypothetical protein